MKADFSGWATKANIRCADGRTIMPDAFAHQDQTKVPLVWQHGHNDPENVLGHAILERRDDGMYAHCFFNSTPKAKHAQALVQHEDINMLSIWANRLVEKGRNVLHGAIREVSLVLNGANPGALIDNVTIQHGDDFTELDDEAIIYTGLTLIHSDDPSLKDEDEDDDEDDENDEDEDEVFDDEDVEDDDDMEHGDMGDKTLQDVYDTLDEDQVTLLNYMIGEALASVEHSDMDDDSGYIAGLKEGIDLMHKNVFEKDDAGPEKHVISHGDMQGIADQAKALGSLKMAVDEYALSHGITDIDLLFPDAQATSDTPEFLKRRTEWVNVILSGVHKSPFSRIKTIWADLTWDDARAKGYVTGALKKEEFFKAARRITTPTTIYKKQKLDRDDMIDITDLDVVAWLKGEMRIMLDEELARAILVGDGRASDDEDKIDEEKIRPISEDSEVYTTTINVNISDASSSIQEFIDALVLNRSKYRGTGLPVMFTTETYIARCMLLKDTTGRDLYTSLEALATKVRASQIVAVEVLEEYEDIIAILVNPQDYTLGAAKGGEVSLFDDFDIDYNQYKYLIETRCCGAMTKLKGALVVKATAANVTLITPTEPTFNAVTGVITIPSQTGVVYKDADNNTLSSGAQAALDAGETFFVYAYPSGATYEFNTTEDDVWSFTRND